jgi:DNA invertase Pin-like site-specific DNA recombinase
MSDAMNKFTPKRPARGERNGNHQLCEEDVRAIRYEREQHGTPYDRIAYLYGISKRQAWRICRNLSWKHVT